MASEKIVHLTKDNFDENTAQGLVLVDFWATWCRPCAMLAPILDQIARESDSLTVSKVDVDAQEELAAGFGVMSIPTLLLFKDGAPVDKIVGVQPKTAIIAMIEKHK